MIGDDRRAYMDYSMAMDLDFQNPANWFERGWCLRRLNLLERALEDVSTAIEVGGWVGGPNTVHECAKSSSGYNRHAIRNPGGCGGAAPLRTP
jgi:hypothetical protein